MATLHNFSGQRSTETNPNRQIDVELDDSNPSELKLRLRQQSWAEGMGWFTQKTIIIDPEEVPALIRQLEEARINIKLTSTQSQQSQPKATPYPVSENSTETETETKSENKIIEFPGHRVTSKTRSASAESIASEPGKVLPFEVRRQVQHLSAK